MTQAVEPAPSRLENFIHHLRRQDRAAFAELRRSLSFDPGTFPPSFPFVERFVMGVRSAWERKAFYLVAGLLALVERPLEKEADTVPDEPEASISKESRHSFGHAVAELYQARGETISIEARFIALLDADEEQLSNRLRQLVGLVHADDVRIGWAQLLKDILDWNHDRRFVQQRWARDFYGRVGTTANSVQDAD